MVVPVVSVLSELSAAAWIRCQSLLVWITLVLLPSLISTVTGLLTNVTFHLPSHRGSSLLAVGTESHTLSFTVNAGNCDFSS